MSLDHVAIGSTQRGLHLDEKVWWLHEVVRNKPSWGPHRYQVLLVRRGEYEYRFEKDLGPELLYPGSSPFNFWAASEYSVGEALEIADRLREGKDPEPREPSDIVGDYVDQLEERKAQRAHRSVSGTAVTIQRS